MTDHYHATPEQWARQKMRSELNDIDSCCIRELLQRVQLLEATLHVRLGTSPPSDEQRNATAKQPRVFTATEPAPFVVPPTFAAGAQVGRSSAAANRMLALQDRIRDGVLTLAEALEEFDSAPGPAADAQKPPLAERVGCVVANFASEGLPGDDAVPAARKILRLLADHLRSDHPNHVGRGTDWADYFDAEADD